MKDKKGFKFEGAIIGNPMDYLDSKSGRKALVLPQHDIIDIDFNSPYPIVGVDYENDKWNNIDLSKNGEYLEHKKRVYNIYTIEDILDKKDILLDIAKNEGYKSDTVLRITNIFNRIEMMKKDNIFSFSSLSHIINYCYYFDSVDSISPENSKELNNIVSIVDNFIRNNRDKIIVEKIFK